MAISLLCEAEEKFEILDFSCSVVDFARVIHIELQRRLR